MKNILIIIITFLKINSCYAQDWSWAKALKGNGLEYALFTCKDASNNYYVASDFYCSNTTIGNQTFTIKGENDIFISKYNVDGTLIWVKQIGGYNEPFGSSGDYYFESINGLVYDTFSNSILICGSYSGDINLGCSILSTTNQIQTYGYLAKISLEGNCIWSKSFGTNPYQNQNDICKTLTYDNLGNIYGTVWSNYADSVGIFRPNTKLIKFDSNGNEIFNKRILSGISNEITGISVIENSLFLVGNINNSNSLKLDTITIDNWNEFGSFISKFDLNGNVNWLKKYSVNLVLNESNVKNIVNDSQNNLYTCSTFSGAKSIINNDTLIANDGLIGCYIVKFDFDGNVKWTKNPKASSYINTSAIKIKDDNIFVTGSFKGNAYFESDTLNILNDNHNMYIASYNFMGSKTGLISTNNAKSFDILVNSNNSFVNCGALFNSTIFGNTTLTSLGQSDAYIAKYDGFLSVPENTRFAKGNTDKLLYIYANPNNGKCNIQIPVEFKTENSLVLRVFDTTGKTIQQKTLINNGEAINIDLEAEAKGTYNASISNGTTTYNGVIVFE